MRKSIAIAALLIFTPASAAPPEGADPAYRDYYTNLRTKNGYGCCSISDCRTVLTKYIDGHPWVFIDKESFGITAPDDWLSVPEDALETKNLAPESPRPAQASACWYAGSIMCFSPALTAG